MALLIFYEHGSHSSVNFIRTWIPSSTRSIRASWKFIISFSLNFLREKLLVLLVIELIFFVAFIIPKRVPKNKWSLLWLHFLREQLLILLVVKQFFSFCCIIIYSKIGKINYKPVFLPHFPPCLSSLDLQQWTPPLPLILVSGARNCSETNPARYF